MIITAKRLGALAVVAVLGSSGYAFMNANTVSSSGAGSGSGPVYGYNISNISYSVVKSGMEVDSSACSGALGWICDVSFEASPQVAGEPAAASAFAALDDSSGGLVSTWAPCTRTAGPDGSNNTYWNCQFSTPVRLHPPTSLDVRATS